MADHSAMTGAGLADRLPAVNNVMPQKAGLASTQQKMQPPTRNEPGAQQPPTAQQLQQIKELQIRQARAKLGSAAFTLTLAEILRKFAKYPPSLTFHIYKTHYRFNNTQDSSIIPKDSPMARSFLQHMIREEIPVEMTELLKDFAIRFYDGCLIVQVYDHRHMITVGGSRSELSKTSTIAHDKEADPKSSQASTPATPSTLSTPAARPKMYRTLLRPTAQSLYYDLLYHTDSTLTKFTDLLLLQMEAEILTLTNRKLDLAAPLNPYLQDEILQPEIELPKVVWDEQKEDYKVIHSHREPTAVEVRKLHQEQMTMQKLSEFEELMFLLSSKYKHPSESTAEKKLVVVGPTVALSAEVGSLEGTPSVGATVGLSSVPDKTRAPAIASTSVLAGGSATLNQFMRLRFIEEIRKRKELQKQQAGAAVAAHTQTSISGTLALSGANGSGGLKPNIKIPGQSSIPGPPVGQPQQNGQLQNQQFHKQQQQQQRAYVGKGPVFSPAAAHNVQTRPVSETQPIPPEYGTSPLPQNTRPPLGIPRQNMLMQNNMQGNPKLTQQPVQAQQQQQQLAKQADQIRAQQFQVQQARQQQMRQNTVHQSPQPSPQNYTQLKQLQQAAQMAQAQAAKRQKLAGVAVNQIPQQSPYPQQMRTPQMGNVQPGSNLNTPVMGNVPMANGLASSSPQMGSQMPQMTQLAQGQASFPQGQSHMGNNRPATQPALTQPVQAGLKTLQQQQRQQHQQIFQMTLTPQEQHTFRQLQTRMNTLVQMGNTGVAPNRTRLTAPQQQQAIQQAKHIQQQLLLRFPTYFQRLRQYQALLEERRLAMQRQAPQGQPQLLQLQPQTQSQHDVANSMGIADSPMYSQQNVGMNMTLPAMQQHMMSLPMMPQMNNGMHSGPPKQ